MKRKTKRKLFFLAVDAILIAAVMIDFPGSKQSSDEIIDDAAID